jgi:hypothetical protein
MATSTANASAPRPPDVLAIVGAELLFAGLMAAVIAGRLGPAVVIGLSAGIGVVGASAAEALRRSHWHSTAGGVLALFLSFAATIPGTMFFLELLRGRAGVCYERPWFGASSWMLLLGPALIVLSALVSPFRMTALPLVILRALHALVWLVGAGNSVLCGMTV